MQGGTPGLLFFPDWITAKPIRTNRLRGFARDCDTISVDLLQPQYCAVPNVNSWQPGGAVALHLETASYASFTDSQPDRSGSPCGSRALGQLHGR